MLQEDIDILCVTETWLKLDDNVKFRDKDGSTVRYGTQVRYGTLHFSANSTVRLYGT